VQRISSYASASRDQAAAGIKALLAANSRDAHRYQLSIVEMRPAAAILRAVDALTPDLVVLGTRGHGRFRRALLGSVATEVLRTLQCDVLLVPERGRHDGERMAG
jgi:nucleotide-binding universal stress UspA family protein